MKKWTFIDTLIVIVVLAAAVLAAVKVLPSKLGSAEKKNVEFTVMIQNKDIELADAMSPGAKATLSLTEKDGGVIKDVKAETATQMTFNSIEGTYDEVPVEGKVDIFVTVTADCELTDKYIKTGGTAIKVGGEIPVRGQGFATSGFVIGIND